jgi:hypothetical protein
MQNMNTRFARLTLILGTLFAAALDGHSVQASNDLPALGAKADATSVSGISSGAYMAGQFQMAHAREVVGAAIIAGGPYGCSESVFAGMMPWFRAEFLNLSKAVNGCMLNMLALWGVPNPGQLADRAKALAEVGRIDPIDAVVSDRVYLFSGQSDQTVVPAIGNAAHEFYTALGVPAENIKHVTNIDAGHAYVTDGNGGACQLSAAPYVVNCHYDQSGDLLKHIYGRLNPRDAAATGTYAEFDQGPFTRDLPNTGLSDRGVVYIPQSCARETGCRVHIALHGCAQNRESVGNAFVHGTELERWADTNRLIVLFPDVATTAFNPKACWDWWGYTGADYLTNKAPQIVALKRMLDRLASAPGIQ